jgi:hypothetical protein
MNPRGKKLEPKLGLNMPFAELVERLMQTDPKEVERSIEKGKQGYYRIRHGRIEFVRAHWRKLPLR